MSSLFDKRLILVVGKGGVGRSTVAASIAAACAKRGRRTLLYQASAKDRFHEFFAAAKPVGPEIVRLRENLHAVNTSPAAALEEYGLMILKFKRVYNMVFENRITKAFIRATPGIDDYAVLGKAWFHTKERKGGRHVWDTLVFDMAASGHSLSMLRIPWAIAASVPEGPLTRDAAEVRTLLTDKSRTSVVMVTMAEDMPTNEAIELSHNFKSHLNLDISQLVVNQLYSERFGEGTPQAAVLDALDRGELTPALEGIRQHAHQSRARWELNKEHLARLERELSVPQVHLPRLFGEQLGANEIDAFAELLEQGAGQASA